MDFVWEMIWSILPHGVDWNSHGNSHSMLEGLPDPLPPLKPPAPASPSPHPFGISRRLRAYLLAGVLVTAPLAITVYLAWLTISLIDTWVAQLLPGPYNPGSWLPFTVPGLGLLIVLAGLTLVGWFAAGFIGRLVLRMGESIVERMPVVRHVYGALKQIFETVLAKQSSAFREVVLLEYPRLGVWSLGFITGPTYWEVQNLTPDPVVNVFIPTTPNPTSGYLLFVPRKDLVKLDVTVEEGLKLVISGGIVLPPDRRIRSQEDARPVATTVVLETPVREGVS